MSGTDHDASLTPESGVESENLLDARIAILANVGLPRERMLQQLLSAGAPIELLKARFAEFPGEAFHRPAPRVLATPRTRRAEQGGGAPSLTAPANARAARPGTNALAPLRLSLPMVSPSPAPIPVAHDIATDGISFHYVPLIQCSFPHADPGEARSFTRRNGWLELTLGTTKPDVGLPYGVPSRLLTIYCASEAVRTRSPEIYLGKSVHDFLGRLDVPITRGARGSLTVYSNQLLRLIHSTLSIDENIRDANGRTGLHLRQALFVEEAQLWWDDRGSVGQGSSLVLSGVLFNSILERSAPLSTKAIRQLRKSPMDLDVYAWLAHRLFHLGKPSSVTWQQLSDQFGHGYGALRPFRRFFIDSLKRVLVVYPEAKLKLTESGVLLLPSKPHVARSVVLAKR